MMQCEFSFDSCTLPGNYFGLSVLTIFGVCWKNNLDTQVKFSELDHGIFMPINKTDTHPDQCYTFLVIMSISTLYML